MAIRFDTIDLSSSPCSQASRAVRQEESDKALRMEITRNVIKSIHKQAEELQRGPQLVGPPVEPPAVPLVNPNPRRHDVVAWRHDSVRLDTTRHNTKEAALEHARALSWVIYRQYMVMDGRDTVEFRAIPIPEGMALDDNDMPVAIN